MLYSPPPSLCPRCHKTLYASSITRPQPRLSRAARLILTAGVLLTALIFWATTLYIRIYQDLFIPAKILAPIALAFALPPGIVAGIVAHRMAKVLRFRCWNCGWREIFRVPRRPGLCSACGHDLAGQSPVRCPACGVMLRATPQRAAPDPPTNRIAAMTAQVPQPPALSQEPSAAVALAHIVDDQAPRREAEAWAYAELATGRAVESVEAELLAQGWPADDAATLAEQARRATRHLRPQMPRANTRCLLRSEFRL